MSVSGGVLIALAATVLFGRFAGFPRLVTIIPSGAPMAFMTALAFLLSGMAFVAHARATWRVARALAATVALLGAGTLVLYVAAQTFEIRPFYYDAQHVVLSKGVRFDGRMSPNVAGSFALLGLALWLLASPRPRFGWVVAIASVLLTVSLLALVSYLTGLRWTAAWWRYTAMAVHTSGGLIFASVALFTRVVRLLKSDRRLSVRSLPFFAAAATTVLVLGAVMFVTNEYRRDTARLAETARDMRTALVTFISAMARLETSTRNYIITGEARYLDRMQRYRVEVLDAAAEVERLATGESQRESAAAALRPLVARKFASNAAQIDARRERGFDAARETLFAEPTEILAGLRAATDSLDLDAARRLERLETETEASERAVRLVLIAGVLIAGVLVTVAFALVERAQRELQRANEVLEERVRERTAELQASTAKVRESAQRMRFLADTMPQLVWTVRPDGVIESVNRGYVEYVGARNEAEAIEVLNSIVHPDDLAASEAEWKAMVEQSRPASGELRLRRHDGVYRWHLWRTHPERNEEGNIARWIGTSTDIHDQKLAEERLEHRVAERTAELGASEARFRQAFHFAGIGMAIVGLDGRWLRVNKSICEIVGYSEAELLNMTFQQITHPDDLAADLAHVRELIDGKRRFYQMEKRYFHRNDYIVWVRLTVSLVRDASGAPAHFVSQVEDITERKELEVSLAAARDQALEASRLKSEFLATMSHEIRTPMNGVIGMTALLRDTPLTETQAEYVRTIESSSESLLTIINDILDYSKIEAGRVELELTAFDLRQCVEDVLDLFAGRAMEKKLELVYEMGPSVPERVQGDAMRLRQVLVNLLSNAIKFTDHGEVVVTVSAEPIAARHRLDFVVRDTGIGIPPEGMSRLFKSFSQVDASTTRRFGGTGLGLAISKRLAELMGGTVWAESAEGEGSKFHFTVLVDALSQPTEPSLHSRQPDVAGCRLLVIDHNNTSRHVLAHLASTWGMHVREAATAHEALTALAENADYDVALIDLHLPDMAGEQLAGAIRELAGGAAIPLVALGRRTRSAPFAQSVSKPVKPEALLNAIRGSVRRGAVRADAAPVAGSQPDSMLGRRCPLRLLVAEDNAVNQKVALLLLQRFGYHADIAANGLEVLNALRVAEYDVILMDVEMPELDGCETTRQIRSERGRIRPWIIALTAGAMPGDRQRALAAGMNDFVTKPVRAEILCAALMRAYAALAETGAPTT
jgi:PAS domain S-box-containing protein